MTVIYFILVFNVTEQYKIIHGLHFISIQQHCLRTQTLVGWVVVAHKSQYSAVKGRWIWVWGQPGLHSGQLGLLHKKPCLEKLKHKNKQKKT